MENGVIGERKWRDSRALDFYAKLLPARQREILRLTCNEDLSLAEVAELLGVSRQAVHEQLKRGEESLQRLERSLALVARYQKLQQLTREFEASIDLINDTERRAAQTEICRSLGRLF